MSDANTLLLYVDDPLRSSTFYESLLGHAPVESAPTFVLFILDGGFKFGLWSRRTVAPAPVSPAGASELAFSVASDDEVHRLHRAWAELGVPALQSPQRLDFGLTFTGVDPDGHRLRVYALSE